MKARYLCKGRVRRVAGVVCATALWANAAFAQNAVRIEPQHGGLGWLTRPYQARDVPAINLANTSRLQALIRSGNLYLTAQDVVALAIENNIDVEVQRYGPLLAREILKRAESGGVLRSVGTGVAAGPTSVSLTGVSVNGSGGGVAGSGGTGVNSGGGILTQLGPRSCHLIRRSPSLRISSIRPSPQSNTALTGTTEFVQDSRTLSGAIYAEFCFRDDCHPDLRQPTRACEQRVFCVKPLHECRSGFLVTQNLLYGFGSAVNGRNIRVQRNNLKVTDLQFKQQLITTVSAVLNLYWDLVSFNQDLQARQEEVRTAQQLSRTTRSRSKSERWLRSR